MTEYTDEQGVRWHKYEVLFDTDEGEFGCEMWAVSEAHALLRIEDLKATARLGGRVLEEKEI